MEAPDHLLHEINSYVNESGRTQSARPLNDPRWIGVTAVNAEQHETAVTRPGKAAAPSGNTEGWNEHALTRFSDPSL